MTVQDSWRVVAPFHSKQGTPLETPVWMVLAGLTSQATDVPYLVLLPGRGAARTGTSVLALVQVCKYFAPLRVDRS